MVVLNPNLLLLLFLIMMMMMMMMIIITIIIITIIIIAILFSFPFLLLLHHHPLVLFMPLTRTLRGKKGAELEYLLGCGLKCSDTEQTRMIEVSTKRTKKISIVTMLSISSYRDYDYEIIIMESKNLFCFDYVGKSFCILLYQYRY